MPNLPKEQIIKAYQDAPALVRETFNSEATVATIRDIRTRYNLHIDTAGTLGENVGYMLLGLLSPSEFFGEMVLAGVDQETAKGILDALNTRIFIPLRDRIMNGGARSKMPPAISYTQENSAQPKKEQREVPPPPAITPKPPEPKVVPPVSEKPIYNVIPAAGDAQKYPMRTMAHDMDLLKKGISPIRQEIQPEHTTPARSFQTASIPVQFSAPKITPAPASVQTPTSAPATTMPEPAVSPKTPAPKAPDTAPGGAGYSADPYREPI